VRSSDDVNEDRAASPSRRAATVHVSHGAFVADMNACAFPISWGKMQNLTAENAESAEECEKPDHQGLRTRVDLSPFSPLRSPRPQR